jgi:hypothetical protein
VLDIGRMQASYIDIRQRRTLAPFLYIQEPFALRDLIGAYITVTGDRSILDDQAGGHSIPSPSSRFAVRGNSSVHPQIAEFMCAR